MFSNISGIYVDNNKKKHLIIENFDYYKEDVLAEDFMRYMDSLKAGDCDSRFDLYLCDPEIIDGEVSFFEAEEQERLSVDGIVNSFFEYSKFTLEDILQQKSEKFKIRLDFSENVYYNIYIR